MYENEPVTESVQPKGPIEVTAEDLADEEWGPVKDKKGKKGKGKKAKEDVSAAPGMSHLIPKDPRAQLQ